MSPYRLTENIYAQDENGVLRLIERVPVDQCAFDATSRAVILLPRDGPQVDVTHLLLGNHPKFTLTKHEDPMHDNCAPCQAGLPEETHAAPDTMLKTAAKTILLVLAVATAAVFMKWCG